MPASGSKDTEADSGGNAAAPGHEAEAALLGSGGGRYFPLGPGCRSGLGAVAA